VWLGPFLEDKLTKNGIPHATVYLKNRYVGGLERNEPKNTTKFGGTNPIAPMYGGNVVSDSYKTDKWQNRLLHNMDSICANQPFFIVVNSWLIVVRNEFLGGNWHYRNFRSPKLTLVVCKKHKILYFKSS